jgi:hypothetical protein
MIKLEQAITKTCYMKFLRVKTTWTNAELIPLKFCIGSAFLLAGAFFHEFVQKYWVAFLVLFVVTLVPSFWGWIRKMKNGQD